MSVSALPMPRCSYIYAHVKRNIFNARTTKSRLQNLIRCVMFAGAILLVYIYSVLCLAMEESAMIPRILSDEK